MQQFIVYNGHDEVLVTTPELEADTLRLYFREGGRDVEDYDREVLMLDELRNSPALEIRMGSMRVCN